MTALADSLVSLESIRAAAARIAGIAVRTPLIEAAFPGVSGYGTGKRIWLKAESLQPIGAFKIRGAANKILQLSAAEIARGVITYSRGNHAQGVAYAAREVGARAVIVMPSNAPAIKRAATLALGAEVVDVGLASSERLAVAEQLVREHGYVVVPPYDDEQIIAGQATCGLEIAETLPDVDLVLSPVSGGGLLSGVAAAVKQLRPQARVFGVEPELVLTVADRLRLEWLGRGVALAVGGGEVIDVLGKLVERVAAGRREAEQHFEHGLADAGESRADFRLVVGRVGETDGVSDGLLGEQRQDGANQADKSSHGMKRQYIIRVSG